MALSPGQVPHLCPGDDQAPEGKCGCLPRTVFPYKPPLLHTGVCMVEPAQSCLYTSHDAGQGDEAGVQEALASPGV